MSELGTSRGELGKIVPPTHTWARKGRPKIPFILLTGWGGQSLEQEKLAESGVDGVMEKPVDVKKLFGMIRKVTPDPIGHVL